MKKDITSREAIELLVNSFYDKVKQDDVIGFIFTDVAQVNWEKYCVRKHLNSFPGSRRLLKI